MIKLTYKNALPEIDTDATHSGMVEDDTLQTAILISLLSWARAEEGQDQHPDPRNLGGWWGDSFADEEGDEIGSKLHLLWGAKVTDAVLELGVQYATEALQWLIEDKIAIGVEVAARRVGDEEMDLDIYIQKPDLPGDTWLGVWEATLTEG